MPLLRQFRTRLNERLLDARAALDPSQYDAFVDWASEHNAAQFAEFLAMPRGYDELSGIYMRAPVVSLEHEFLWVASRVRSESERVNLFLQGARAIEGAVLQGQFVPAIEALALMQEALGVSMWSVQLRLALEQLAGGLEEQKRYAAEVRAVFRRGLLSFTTYHTSVRNEERTTLAKYVDDVVSRVERIENYPDALKTYLTWRLAGRWPTSEQGFSDILRTEQSHALVDAYETMVAILQEMVRRGTLAERRETVAACLEKLAGIRDFRLDKLRRLVAPGEAVPPFDRDAAISDALLAGNVRAAARTGMRRLRSDAVIDPWDLIHTGLALGHGRRTDRRNDHLATAIARTIGLVAARAGDQEDHAMILRKLALNLRGLPVAVAIQDFLAQLFRDEPDAPWAPWHIGMNAPSFGIEDLPEAGSGGRASPTVTARTWSSAACASTVAQSMEDLAARPLFEALALLRARTFDDAAALLEGFLPESGPVRTLRAALLLHAYAAAGRRPKVIDLVADEGSRSEAHRRALPVAATLRHFAFSDFAAASAPLAPPIALHLLWRADERAQTASQMRLATVRMLRGAGSRRPSQLADAESSYPRHQLTYFLWRVCRPDVLDVSRVVRNSQEVREERRAICQLLIEIDAPNAFEYETEVQLIDEEIAIDEGRWIVDTTRIHVDIDAFNRWARREIAEDFNRYCDLIAVQLGDQQNFDEVLKELEANPAQRTLFTPENEADAVLVSMLRRLGDEFLNNPNFGLDFYLSKRIRHQSFIGLIRGPLEFSNLITTRESETGDYHVNALWLAKFSTMPEPALEAIDKAIRAFASRFDETLIAAKDQRFHIRSAEHPAGLLRINISPQLIALVRALVRFDAGFEDFLATAIAVFWAALEQSLGEARKLISEEIKSEIIAGVDALRASVRKVAEADPAFLEFAAAVSQQSAAVQQALDEAAGWFTHLDPELYRRHFSLEQAVSIAVESALKCQRGFEPVIVKRTEGDLQLSASSMVFVHDVIFVALSNVHNHCGVRNPRVELNVSWDEPGSTIRIEVVNEGRPASRADKLRNLKSIRDMIERREFSVRTRREGGSGFLKLAAVVTQSSSGDISFDLSPDGKFRLEVVYSLSVRQEVIDAEAA